MIFLRKSALQAHIYPSPSQPAFGAYSWEPRIMDGAKACSIETKTLKPADLVKMAYPATLRAWVEINVVLRLEGVPWKWISLHIFLSFRIVRFFYNDRLLRLPVCLYKDKQACLDWQTSRSESGFFGDVGHVRFYSWINPYIYQQNDVATFYKDL